MVNIERIDGVLRRERVFEDIFFCDPKMLESICFNVKSQLGYIWLKDIVVTINDNEVEVRYLFYFLENNYKFTLILNTVPEHELKSIAHIWLNALYMEQEIHELFGINFSRLYPNMLFSAENKVHPMGTKKLVSPEPKTIQESGGETLFEDSSALSTLQFSITWQKNLIKKSSIVSGSFHSGLEKIVEGSKLLETTNLLENFFGHRSSLWSMSLIKSIENFNQLKIPDRAMALRMIVQEFLRIIDHLYFLRNIHMEMKHPEGTMNFVVYIKTIQSLMISFSGNENLHGVNSVGGLFRDVDQIWMSRVMDELDQLEKKLRADLQTSLSNGFVDKALGFPLLDKTLAYGKCLSGPIARSVGLNLDLRKSDPEYFYNDIDFDVPIGTSGSAFDLYSVKFQEILQSIRIIIQVLDNLPTGFISIKGDKDITVQKVRREILNDKEYLKAFEEIMNSPTSSGSYFLEGPNGHIGMTSMINDAKINRLKLFSNDFLL